MEQKEAVAADKAAHLMSVFEQSFLDIHTTFHPSGLKGEIAGKSSNVACAARRIMEIHRTELKIDCCNVIVTVMDGMNLDTIQLKLTSNLEQPTPTFLAITSLRSVAYTMPIWTRQTARSIAALFSLTAIRTKCRR